MSISALTFDCDRAQQLLSSILIELEDLQCARTGATSVNFRLSLLSRATKVLYRLASVRKTLCAMRIDCHEHVNGLSLLNTELRCIHATLRVLQSRLPSKTPTPTTPPPPASPPDFTVGLARRPGSHRTMFKPAAPITRPPKAAATEQSKRRARFTADSQPTPCALIPAIRKIVPKKSRAAFAAAAQSATPSPARQPEPISAAAGITPAAAPAFKLFPLRAPASKLRPTTADRINSLFNQLPKTVTNPPIAYPAAASTPRPFFPLLNLDLLPRTRTAPAHISLFTFEAPPAETHSPAPSFYLNHETLNSINASAEQILIDIGNTQRTRWKRLYPESYPYVYGPRPTPLHIPPHFLDSS